MSNYLQQRLQLKLSGNPPKEKKIYTIAERSKKKIAFHKVYNPFVAEYLSRPENAYCKIRWERCTGKATTINHKKRRYKDTVMNEEFIEQSCTNCNLDIECDDVRARAEGHLLSKFTKG